MRSTLRRTWAEINLDNLAYNYKTIRAHVGENVKFLGVVKADAYGHGSVYVSKKLESLGADYLAVSSIDEAMELRLNGYTPREQVERLIQFGITQAVTSREMALEYNEVAKKCGAHMKAHIKVDTGMSRLGFLCEGEDFGQSVSGIAEACRLPYLMIDQVEKETGKVFRIRHCANTGASVRYPDTYLDMVRPGILLYGYGEFAKELGLKPVMSLKTTVSAIKMYPAGTKISYGGTYVTENPTRMGVLPYGYADGFFRCLSNRYSIMSKEGPAPVRGRICMDMCMVDLTDKPTVDVGSEMEIFGEKNPIEVMADQAGTITYELVCAVSKRVPRVYMEDGVVIDKELLLRM